jgi:tetratricopeptide (TPR) repeat protein
MLLRPANRLKEGLSGWGARGIDPSSLIRDDRMYLRGSKWSMNRRRQHFNWFRILVLTLLIGAGLYLDKYVIPSAPSMFEATPTATRPTESYLTEAQNLFDQGKLNQSIQVYQQAVEVKPNDPSIYVALAEVQVFAGDYKGAQASAENALLLNPSNSMAHAMRAWALDFQGNPLEAEASIKRALELDANNAVAHAFYAEILVDQGQGTIPKAIDESKIAQGLAPNTLITHRARGYVLEATANYEEAVREYQAAVALNKNIPDLHLQLGINYSALGIYDQAVQEFSNANALNPADPMPDYLTSRTYSTVGEFAKARQYAETAVKDDPTNPRYHGNLGVMDYHTALFADAVKELGLAVTGGVTDTGDKVEPIELVPNAPRVAEIYFTYALALAKVGRCGDTLQVAQTVQSRIPTDDIAVTNVNQAIQTCQAGLSSSGSPSTLLPSLQLTPAAGTRTPFPAATLTTPAP